MDTTATGTEPLLERNRSNVVEALDASLADVVDLWSQAKAAHWNVKGPQFAALHRLFDELASSLAGHADTIAERAVAIGGTARGTVREAARRTRLPELPAGLENGLDEVRALLESYGRAQRGLRAARDLAASLEDPETVDLLTAVLTELEKQSWFLRATLA